MYGPGSPGFPLLELRIGGVELRALKNVPLIEVHAVDDADFVAVLQVLADSGKIDLDLDAVPFQFCAWADAGEHQELRRVEGASREDDLARGMESDEFRRAARSDGHERDRAVRRSGTRRRSRGGSHRGARA